MTSASSRILCVASIAGALAMSLCATACSAEQIRSDEAQQLAWQGPGSGPCIAGGVTPAAAEHCGYINFGIEGQLGALNHRASELAWGGDSRTHALCVEGLVAGRWPVTFARVETRQVVLWEIPLGTQQIVALVHADGVWALDDGGADLYGANTVEEALLRSRVGDYAVLGERELAELRRAVQDEVPQAAQRLTQCARTQPLKPGDRI